MLARNTFIYILLSALLGLTYALLLEEYNYLSYFVVIVITSLFYLWTKTSHFKAFFGGLIFGFSLSLYALRWMFGITEHFGVNDNISYSFIFLILLAISLTYALCAFSISLISKHKYNKFLFVLALASCLLLTEWLQTWIFTGFPYLQVSYYFIDTPLAGFMPIIGSLGVSFIIAILSALLLLIITHIHNKKVILSSLLSMGIIFSVGYILNQIEFTTALETKKVRVINGNISKKDKQKLGIVETTINEYLAISNKEPLANLVIWSESSIPDSFHLHHRTKLHKEFTDLKQKGVNVLLGTYLTEMKNGINRYNVLLVGGDIGNKYYKRHRVPFGEYMPKILTSLFPPDLIEDIEEVDFKQQPITINDMTISPNICFEIMFPELIMENTNLIINTSDLSWFNDNVIVKKMNLISRIRSLEAEKYLIRSDNRGNSLIINHKGGIIKQTTDAKYIEDVVQLRSGNTPYTVVGNLPFVVLSIMTLLLIYLRQFISKKKS